MVTHRAPQVEWLESRTLFSFSATVSAVPTAVHGQNFTLHLVTHGGVVRAIAGWSITWGDGNSDTVNNPSGLQVLSKTHQYASPSLTETITATATSTTGAVYVARFALDSTFGANNTGQTTTTPTSGNNNANAMVVDSSGNIFVAGADNTTTFGVTRYAYSGNGTPDSNFGDTGTPGTKSISFDSGTDVANAIALSPAQDKVFVAGAANGHLAVACISPTTGALDSNFGTGGKVELSQTGVCNGIYVDANTNSYLVGSDANLTHFVVVKLNNTGVVQWTKNTLAAPNDTDNIANAVIADPASSSKIVVGGQGCHACGSDFVLFRLNESNGTLDTAFGDPDGLGHQTGYATVNFGACDSCTATVSTDSCYSLLPYTDSTNHIIAVGKTNLNLTGSVDQFAIARFNDSGTNDGQRDSWGDNNTGLVIANNGDAYAAAIQSDGKIIAVGKSNIGSTNDDFAVARFNVNGSADTSFGSGGKMEIDFGSGTTANYEAATGVAIDPNSSAGGSFWVTGWTGTTASGGSIALTKILPSNTISVS